MKVGFVVDPLGSLHKTKDTSMLLMQYASQQGYEVWCCDSDKLYFDSEVCALMQKVIVDLSGEPQFEVVSQCNLSIKDLDICFIRKDPPVDEHYISMLQLLSIVEDLPGSPFWINSPRALLMANEKLYGLRFAEYFPPTVISCSSHQIIKFQEELRSTLVIKPLNEYSSRGIFVVSETDINRDCIFKQGTKNDTDYVIAQKFLERVTQGDKRVFFIDGEVKGVVSRIPRTGEYRCALGLGASVELSLLTTKEKQICLELAETFRSDGMFFVGIDIIDGHLIEVNVTSPTVVRQYCELSGDPMDTWIYEKILEKI